MSDDVTLEKESSSHRRASRVADVPDAPRTNWLPVIVVVIAILVGSGAIVGAIIWSADRGGSGSSQAAGPDALTKPGCEAWVSARQGLEAIPALPNGWDWNTPNIDQIIGNQQGAIKPVLDNFEKQVGESGAEDIEGLASGYIAAQRNNMDRQVQRNATAVDGERILASYKALNAACGLV